MKTIVMKFGGSSVCDTPGIKRVAQIVEKRAQNYDACVVVVSAMGNMTDNLIKKAKEINSNPPQREYDMLISVGERISCSLLSMALNVRDIKSVSLTGSQSGIITNNKHTAAQIVEVRPFRLIEHLKMKEIVIVAGFQGVNDNKDITTLGRGGSDTSAVALALALNAQKIEFYKDVDGIYNLDPKKNQNALFIPKLTHQEALDLVCEDQFILHPRSLKLAQKNNLPLNVLSFKNSRSPGTLVGCLESKRPQKKLYEIVK